jgi:hypothetical protein
MEMEKKERRDREEESSAQASQSKEVEKELEQHNEVRVDDQRANQDEETVEDQAGFEEVIYGRNRKRQRQQVITGTSSESGIKAEKKKPWVYLRRMTQETMAEV